MRSIVYPCNVNLCFVCSFRAAPIRHVDHTTRFAEFASVFLLDLLLFCAYSIILRSYRQALTRSIRSLKELALESFFLTCEVVARHNACVYEEHWHFSSWSGQTRQILSYRFLMFSMTTFATGGSDNIRVVTIDSLFRELPLLSLNS